jgi:hypothetical protein
MGLAVGAAPGNPVVRLLIDYLGIEFPLNTTHLGHPVVGGVGHLGNRFHTGHELRKGLELGPLVVRGPHRDSDIDGLFNVFHLLPPHDGRPQRRTGSTASCQSGSRHICTISPATTCVQTFGIRRNRPRKWS